MSTLLVFSVLDRRRIVEATVTIHGRPSAITRASCQFMEPDDRFPPSARFWSASPSTPSSETGSRPPLGRTAGTRPVLLQPFGPAQTLPASCGGLCQDHTLEQKGARSSFCGILDVSTVRHDTCLTPSLPANCFPCRYELTQFSASSNVFQSVAFHETRLRSNRFQTRVSRVVVFSLSGRPHARIPLSEAFSNQTHDQTWFVLIQSKVQSQSQQHHKTRVFSHGYPSLWALGGEHVGCRQIVRPIHSRTSRINVGISRAWSSGAVRTDVRVANRL
jgi:hypothetical protein